MGFGLKGQRKLPIRKEMLRMKNKISTSEVLQEVLMAFHAKDKLKEIEALLEEENVSIEDVKKVLEDAEDE